MSPDEYDDDTGSDDHDDHDHDHDHEVEEALEEALELDTQGQLFLEMRRQNVRPSPDRDPGRGLFG